MMYVTEFEGNLVAEPLLMNEEKEDSTMSYLSSIGFNVPNSSIDSFIWNFLYLVLTIFNPFYWLDNSDENDIEKISADNRRLLDDVKREAEKQTKIRTSLDDITMRVQVLKESEQYWESSRLLNDRK